MESIDKQPISQTKSFKITNDGITYTADTSQVSLLDVQKVVLSADSLGKLIAEYKRIESTQNGVCDTCVTGYVSALIEYRTISKELSDRTHDLRVKLDAVKLLNSNAYSLVNQFQRQSGEIENIVSLRANLILENNKQVAELRKGKSDLTSSKALIDKARY